MEVQSFDTREALLALSLTLAGIEPLEEKQPCFNLFDEEILSKLGFGKASGQEWKLREAANEAWESGLRGDVGYILKMTPRTADLIRAYREQCKEIENCDGKSGDMILKIIEHGSAGAILPDEMILRIACVILKTRGQYVNLWKFMVPLLRIPVDGKAKHFDTTATVKTRDGGSRTVEAKGVQRPGFMVVSLNLSEEKRKHIGL